MLRIFKYQLNITDEQTLQLHDGAKILSVGEQAGVGLCLWAAVNLTKPVTPREIYIIGTGNPVQRAIIYHRQFVGTVQMSNGLVWHVFADQEE